MGVIKKKTAVRGTEGGVKYVCDICSADITSTVRIRCAHSICKDYDLCVPCFSDGASSREHDPSTHPFSVIEQHSIPIFTEDWGADEEALLLEGAETYGLGSWADIADHIGGFRDKDEVRDHYINTYVKSSKFPLPEHASPADRELVDAIPREEFQARKKRRIEERKEAAKNAPPAAPKQKPTASVPSCHEVQGYMPGRLEFETEFFNEAEEAVQHMQFDPLEAETETELKMIVMHIYNNRLTARVERKKVIFEHDLLEYRKNMAADKKRSKEERDLYNKCRPFARLMQHEDFENFAKDIEYELSLRQAIAQLQEWRQMQISDLKTGEKYEQEKAARAARNVPLGSLDRFSTSRASKPNLPADTPTMVLNLTSPDLDLRNNTGLNTPPYTNSTQTSPEQKPLANDTSHMNGTGGTNVHRPKFQVTPLNNVTPLKLNNENAQDLHLLTEEEQEICSVLRIMPKPFMAMKESLLKEAARNGGSIKKKTAKEICKIDAIKGGKLFDYLVHSGWISKG